MFGFVWRETTSKLKLAHVSSTQEILNKSLWLIRNCRFIFWLFFFSFFRPCDWHKRFQVADFIICLTNNILNWTKTANTWCKNGYPFFFQSDIFFFWNCFLWLFYYFHLVTHSFIYFCVCYSPDTNRSKIGVDHQNLAVSLHAHWLVTQRNCNHKILKKDIGLTRPNGIASPKSAVYQYTKPF